MDLMIQPISPIVVALAIPLLCQLVAALQSHNCTGEAGNGPLDFEYSDDGPHMVCSHGGDVQCVTGEPCCITCQASNVCDLQWYREGILINDSCPSTLSYYCDQPAVLMFNPQTSMADYVGSFACEVSNKTNTLWREFNILAIEAPPYTGPPVERVVAECSDQQAAVGDNVTFYCQFCAHEKTYELEFDWLRQIGGEEESDDEIWVPVEDLNITGTSFSSYIVLNASQGQTSADSCAGSFLMISNVTPEAFGLYKLLAVIESTLQSNETEPLLLYQAPDDVDATLVLLIAIFSSMAALLLLAILWLMFHLDIMLFLKDRFGTVEDKGQRSYDAFIAYDSSSEADRTFVLELMRPKLMEKNYHVYVKDIDTNAGTSLAEEILEAMEISLRCILVISPSFASSRLAGLQVNTAADQMWDQRTKVVPILFGDMDAQRLRKTGSDLANIASVLRCMRYREGRTDRSRFLKRLLLRMPRRARRVLVNEMLLDTTSDTARLTPEYIF